MRRGICRLCVNFQETDCGQTRQRFTSETESLVAGAAQCVFRRPVPLAAAQCFQRGWQHTGSIVLTPNSPRV